MIAACPGLDQLTHALEAMTALPYNQRPAPEHPKMRPAYQGSNPISNIWASRAIEMMRKVGMPNGLNAVSYGPHDVDRLVEGTLPQHRVTKLSPRPAAEADLAALFEDALAYW